jgi:glycosyltransferase involved in cell wall biosynthesis
VDFFNAIGKRFDVRLLFLQENLSSQAFDQRALRERLRSEYRFATRGFEYRGRLIRLGINAEIDGFGPDVVVSSEFSPTTLQILVKNRVRRRSFAHVVMTDDNPELLRLRDTPARRTARRFVMRAIHGLVVISRETAALYRSQLKARGPIGVCPILRDEAVFREEIEQATEESRSLIARHALQGKRVVLFVGRLSREKRVDRAIIAFANSGMASRNTVLVVVGDGSERASLEALARSCGIGAATVFAGRLEGTRLLAWYRVGGVLVLPSEWEAFGAVVNEALLAGMPVICSEKAGARSLIASGASGTIVDWDRAEHANAAVSFWCESAMPASELAARPLRASLVPVPFSDTVSEFARVVTEASETTRTNHEYR